MKFVFGDLAVDRHRHYCAMATLPRVVASNFRSVIVSTIWQSSNYVTQSWLQVRQQNRERRGTLGRMDGKALGDVAAKPNPRRRSAVT
jgi:hypothetical protein